MAYLYFTPTVSNFRVLAVIFLHKERSCALILSATAPFYIPVSEMLSEQGKAWYDEEMIRMIGDTIFEHFPDIAENPYILQDKAELSQHIFRELLKVIGK